MGNTGSCSCISNNSVSVAEILKKKGKGAETAMLLDTAGNSREIKLPMKSAELMVEAIGHAVAPVEELRRTRRIKALPADEELVAGKVYLLVPVSRVHSKASEFEMALADKKSGQREGSNVANKVSRPFRLMEMDGENEVAVSYVRPKLRNQVPWNPVLDPIFESS